MKKKFDCVEMKLRLQDEMRRKEERGEASWESLRAWLDTGDDLLASWWRRLPSKTVRGEEPLVLREDPVVYRTKGD